MGYQDGDAKLRRRLEFGGGKKAVMIGEKVMKEEGES